MKQLIKDVLEDLSRGQVNLGSEAAREVVATTIMITLKEKGEYKKYTDDDLEEQEAREYWVCQICKKSSYDLDWDYIGTGTNHLSCEVRLAIDKDENTEKYQKEKESLFPKIIQIEDYAGNNLWMIYINELHAVSGSMKTLEFDAPTDLEQL